jgi:ribonuclease BN (tRNA processing enzyme)
MQVTLLGTGAPLAPTRATMGMIVTAPGCRPLLIDTCGGFEVARQVLAAGFKLADLRDVVVTHRHLDHTGGMQALYLARMPLDIHASTDTHEGIATITAGCFPEWERHADVRHHTVASGEARDIGGFRVSFAAVEHRVPTLAVRVEAGGKVFAYSADCLPCEGALTVAKGADLFLCDAICAAGDGEHAVTHARRLMHPNAVEAAEMALQAGAGQLALCHIGRFGDPERIREEATGTFGGPVHVPLDLDRLDV